MFIGPPIFEPGVHSREPGEQGSKLLPTKLLGQQLVVHPAPPVKSNLTDSKVTFKTKILENSPASGALPQTPLYTAYTFFEKYILHKVIL